MGIEGLSPQRILQHHNFTSSWAISTRVAQKCTWAQCLPSHVLLSHNGWRDTLPSHLRSCQRIKCTFLGTDKNFSTLSHPLPSAAFLSWKLRRCVCILSLFFFWVKEQICSAIFLSIFFRLIWQLVTSPKALFDLKSNKREFPNDVLNSVKQIAGGIWWRQRWAGKTSVESHVARRRMKMD